MLYAFIWTLLFGKKHIAITDATLLSENHLTKLQRIMRKVVFPFTNSFICISNGGFELYQSYNIPKEKIFKSCLCIKNERFSIPVIEREFHLLFSGQLIPRKNVQFFLNVVKLVKIEFPDLKVLIIGDGPLKEELIEKFKQNKINCFFAGFVAQADLPDYYGRCKILLFPTKYDAWGVIANEAMASGIPVIVSPFAGCANDLVINNYNGFVLPLIEELWADTVLKIIKEKVLYNELSQNSIKKVSIYNYENSVDGILNGIYYAHTH